MAITTDDFNKIWASTSPLTPYSFSESQYKEGWNFIGSTPPSRQMWDFLQKNNDEKMQYLLNHFDNYLPLSGGTMTGFLQFNASEGRIQNYRSDNDGMVSVYGGQGYTSGGYLAVYGKNHASSAGMFRIFAGDDTNGTKELRGTPAGALTWNSQPLLPVGVVQAFAGTTIPNGWLLCDGSAVSRTTYASLYACIGTTYGAGDGSTTFNLPNLVDKFVEGSATAGTVKSAGLPNITGSFGLRPVDGGQNVTWESDNGAVKATTKTGDNSSCVGKGSSSGPLINVTIDASRSSAIYGKSDTVQPPALTMRYIIKY